MGRIHNILKRTRDDPQVDKRIVIGELILNLEQQQVSCCGEPLTLATMEYRLLELLARAPGKPFSRDEIINALKGTEAELFTRSVDILVSRVRHKMRPLDYIDRKQRIIRDLREMETQLSELLETERLNGRHVKLDLSIVSVAGLIDEVIEQYFPQTPVLRHPIQADTRVEVDVLRMRLLIKNLLDNAIRHTPPPGCPPAGDRCPLQCNRMDPVRQGSPPRHRPRTAAPADRGVLSGGQVTTAQHRRLWSRPLPVQRHRQGPPGELTLLSEPGQGTEVRVTLPRGSDR